MENLAWYAKFYFRRNLELFLCQLWFFKLYTNTSTWLKWTCILNVYSLYYMLYIIWFINTFQREAGSLSLDNLVFFSFDFIEFLWFPFLIKYGILWNFRRSCNIICIYIYTFIYIFDVYVHRWCMYVHILHRYVYTCIYKWRSDGRRKTQWWKMSAFLDAIKLNPGLNTGF